MEIEKSPNGTVVDAVRGFFRLFTFFILTTIDVCDIIYLYLSMYREETANGIQAQ